MASDNLINVIAGLVKRDGRIAKEADQKVKAKLKAEKEKKDGEEEDDEDEDPVGDPTPAGKDTATEPEEDEQEPEEKPKEGEGGEEPDNKITGPDPALVAQVAAIIKKELKDEDQAKKDQEVKLSGKKEKINTKPTMKQEGKMNFREAIRASLTGSPMAEGYESHVLEILNDEGIDGPLGYEPFFEDGKLLVMKGQEGRAKKALKNSGEIRKLPKIVGEEKVVDEKVEIDDGKLTDEESELQKKYKEFYDKMLAKFGVKSPGEMDDDKKKEFFNAIEKGWKEGEGPVEEQIEESREPVSDDGRRKGFKEAIRRLTYEKLRKLHDKAKSEEVRRSVERWSSETLEESKKKIEIDEAKSGTGYELYHKDFSSAMQHAYDHAKKKGFVVDPGEIDDKVATGPKKPSSGKTNRYILGTDKKKNVHIQVANLDNKRYELNMYIESIDDHLGKVKNILKRINLNEVDLDERRAETPAEWEKRTGKKPTKQTFDKAQADKKKDAFLKAYQGTKEKEKPKKTTSVRKQRYVQKPSYRTREVPYREKPAEIAQHFKLPDYIVHDDIKKFPRILMGGIDKIAPGVKFKKHVISHQTFGKIPGLGIFLPGDSSPKLMIQWNQRINDPKIDYIWADPKYAEKGTDPSTYRKNDMVVWINEAATNNPALKGKVDWYQRKEFEGATPDDAAKRTLQYLKTKIKRMAKEEVELASMTEEIQKLEERRQSYSNFIPFPRKILTDFAKRAKKAGLTSYKYLQWG